MVEPIEAEISGMRRREVRRAEGVNPLEERAKASSKGAKVRWKHTILMEERRVWLVDERKRLLRQVSD